MKWLGLILVVAVMNYYGQLKVGEYKRQVVFWKQATGIVQWYLVHLRTTADPPDKIWRCYAAVHEEQAPTVASWMEGHSSMPHGQEFNEFIQGLGTTDLEGQLSLCQRHEQLCMARHEEAQTLYQTKGKVTGKLWMLSSVAVVLLLL